MIDDELVLRVERLRDSLEDFKTDLRRRYRGQEARVAATAVREAAAQLAERWLVEVSAQEDVRVVITDETLADLNIQFQRLLRYSEANTARGRYDSALNAILTDFRGRVVIPLKQSRGRVIDTSANSAETASTDNGIQTVFVGHSFAVEDALVNDTVKRFLCAFGLTVVTGEKPAAETVSAKVRARIESCEIFVGVFTRRHKLASGEKWSTSEWIVDEKAYALAKSKTLILLKERGVDSIGGLQGDYEYLEFQREKLEDLLIRLLELLGSLSGITMSNRGHS